MAKNFVQEGRYLFLNVGTGVKAGDPVAVGDLTGVATIDADANGNATVDTEACVYSLSVKGVNGSGNSAVAVGDILYYVANDTPPLSKKNSGVEYGHALAAVNAGATATISVKLTEK